METLPLSLCFCCIFMFCMHKSQFCCRIITTKHPKLYRTIWRVKNQKAFITVWLPLTFVSNQLTSDPLNIYGGLLRSEKAKHSWHHKRLFQALAHNAGIMFSGFTHTCEVQAAWILQSCKQKVACWKWNKLKCKYVVQFCFSLFYFWTTQFMSGFQNNLFPICFLSLLRLNVDLIKVKAT